MCPIKFSSSLDSSGKTKYGESFLRSQAISLIDFTRGSKMNEGGFGYLNSTGKVDLNKPREVYIQCRMIQVLGLAQLFDMADSNRLIDHGIDALLDLFHDKDNGGFFNSIDLNGKPFVTHKLAYDQMFVLLAACTAKVAGSARADELLSIIDGVIDNYYWDEDFQMMRNTWNMDFSILDNYRGINANMHAVEALSAAYDVTGDEKYRNRAYLICKRTIQDFAKVNSWMLPEHFNEEWIVDKDFNIDNPADPFCPFGVTIGHLFEWSRLILQLKLQIEGSDLDDSWIDQGAIGLYEKAKEFGWSADGTEGFVYTIDWDGKPVVRSRMFWVAAEAVMTAYTLWILTKESKYLDDYSTWWEYIDRHVIDHVNGSWFHELDPMQKVVAHTWPGKPDTYHAFNSCVLPLFPLGTSFVGTALDLRRSNI
jgi:mannose/cellobiose epimerase-like protein (N-acyl-D-glucosamine 2-epimerase family)